MSIAARLGKNLFVRPLALVKGNVGVISVLGLLIPSHFKPYESA